MTKGRSINHTYTAIVALMARLVGPKNICAEFMSDNNNHTDTERSIAYAHAPVVPCKTTHRTKTTRLNICSLRRRRRSRSFSSSRRCRRQPTAATANPHVACRLRSLAVACCMRCLPARSTHVPRRIYLEQLCPNRSMYARPLARPAGRRTHGSASQSVEPATTDERPPARPATN